MKNRLFSFGIVLQLFVLLSVLMACKKERTETPVNIQNGTRAQLSLDSLFLYAKETYLWNDALPDYAQFNPQKYTSHSTDLENLQKELFDITQYKVYPSTNLPYEFVSSAAGYPKYSFISAEATAPSQKKSSISLNGAGNDFGFALTAIGSDDFRIRYVSPGSPAALAGLARGYRIVKINGRAIRADVQGDVDYVNASFDQQTMALNVQKTDKKIFTDIVLQKAAYASSPVLKKATLILGSKYVGYIAFARFSSLQNSQADLDQAFSEFASAGIADLVVDLRYNSGGYVETAEYLGNLIAPPALSGSVMYTEYYNQLMQAGKTPILSRQILFDENNKPVTFNGRIATYVDLDYSVKGNTRNFSKKGSLNTVRNVYFIISGTTASASELVINSLKPYLNVVLIGSKSYGKPVGFFGIKIDKYIVYMSQFQSRNSRGEGDYFNGFAADFPSIDDVTRDFGNMSEISLAQALALIKTGTTSTANSTMTVQGEGEVKASDVKLKNIGADNEFNGMVESRIKLK